MRTLLGILACVSLSQIGPAWADDPTILYSETLRGGLVATGNTLGLEATCPPLTDCLPNGASKGGSIGTFIASPSGYGTEQNGSYPLGTTNDWKKNGSIATLDLPPSATVKHAELIWTCSTKHAQATLAANADKFVYLRKSNQSSIQVNPDTDISNIGLVSSNYNYYQRNANVTDYVKTHGAGVYEISRVAGIATSDGSNVTACGWGLFVAYADPGAPYRNVTLWNVAKDVRYTVQSPEERDADIIIEGFCTPESTNIVPEASLTVAALEGDVQYDGDMLLILDYIETIFANDGNAYYMPLWGPNNPWSNFFSSQINASDGRLDTRGSFGNNNHSVIVDNNDMSYSVEAQKFARQGFDITTIPINDNVYNPGLLINGQDWTAFWATTSRSYDEETFQGDDYIISAIGLSIDFDAPTIVSDISIDRERTFTGDQVTFTVTLTNDSTVRADSVHFCFEGSENLDFVSLDFEGTTQNVTASQIRHSQCEGSGGFAIGSIAPNQSKDIILSYTVSGLVKKPIDKAYVNGTPSWRSSWTPSCDGASSEISVEMGQPVRVPGAILEATLTSSPSSPPALPNGTVVTYTFTLTNVGQADTPGSVEASLPLPEGVNYVEGSASLNGVPVPDDNGGNPFETPQTVQSEGAPSGVIRQGEEAVIVIQATIDMDNAGTIRVTGEGDIDGDGPAPPIISNPTETQVLAPPAPNDRDQDGIPDDEDNCPDVWNPDQEDNYPTGNPNGIGDHCDDVDGDGITDWNEDHGPDGQKGTGDETDPENYDTDGDGLCDGAIIVGNCVGVEDLNGDFNGADRGVTEPDPLNPDSDGDGLCDGFDNGGNCFGSEYHLGTDPMATDTDRDGLCDGVGVEQNGGVAKDGSGCLGSETNENGEYIVGVYTDPTNPDTDGDGLCDGFYNPYNGVDPDCRGGEDVNGNRDPADYAHPGGTESNPLNPDTDGGGVDDGTEYDLGTNPRDPCDDEGFECPSDDGVILQGGGCNAGASTELFWILGLALSAMALQRRPKKALS